MSDNVSETEISKPVPLQASDSMSLMKLTGLWILFSVLGEKNVRGETGSTRYWRTVCIARRIYVCFAIWQSWERREGGGDLNNLQHTLWHTNTLDYQTSQLPPEREEMIRKSVVLLIWTEKKHLQYIFTLKIRWGPGCSNHAYLNSATMWHYTSHERHMVYISWHVFTPFPVNFLQF